MPDVKAARALNQGHYRKKDVFVLGVTETETQFARTTAKTYNTEMDKSILKWLSGRGVSPRDLTSVRFSY